MHRHCRSRARVALLVLLTLALVAAGADPATAAPDQDVEASASPPGKAQAIAELVQVDPAIANLALTIRFGTALAGHQNLAALAEAKSVDLGFLGDILTTESSCDGGEPSSTLPPSIIQEPVVATSEDPTHADGVTGGLDGLIDIVAAAAAGPATASSSAEIAPLGLPGLVTIEGARSNASSSADGHVATAISEIGRLELVGGLVAIEGLRWEATRRLLPEASSATTFDVGRLIVAGIPIRLAPDGVSDSLAGVLDPLLQPLGVALDLPRTREIPNGVELTPLTVGVEPGEIRDTLLGPVFSAVQPSRSALSDFLIDLDCGNSTYVTVLDVVLGAVSGAGFAVVDLGGVRVQSEELTFTSFLGGGGSSPSTGTPPATTPATTPSTGGTSSGSSSGSSGALGTTGSSTTAVARPTPGTASTTPVDDVAPIGDEQAIGDLEAVGERGGPLAFIGLAGLLLLGAAAYGDRRKMRAAQRSIPMD